MNTKVSSHIDLSELSTEETSVITLIPCEYDSSEENCYVNSSQDSIDSSDLVDDSDGEIQIITEIFIENKNLGKDDKKSDEKNVEHIIV